MKQRHLAISFRKAISVIRMAFISIQHKKTSWRISYEQQKNSQTRKSLSIGARAQPAYTSVQKYAVKKTTFLSGSNALVFTENAQPKRMSPTLSFPPTTRSEERRVG